MKMGMWKIRISEWVVMFLHLMSGNRQWFAGRWWDAEEVLVTLADVYGITVNPQGGGTKWIQEIFKSAYTEYHSASNFANQWSVESKCVSADMENYVQYGRLPYYIMRRRIECVSAKLVRALQQ